MPGMKRTLALFAFGLGVLCLGFGQTIGLGAAAAAGPAFQGGDPTDVAKRILSTTSYKPTPGDVYALSITMTTVTTYPLLVHRNYDLEVPYVGTLNVKDMTYEDMQSTVTDRLRKLLPLSQFITLALQSPARFDVPVFGGVVTPGVVTVYPLTRVSDAVVLAGKRAPGATYRAVTLIRGSNRINVDFYQYQLDASEQSDPYLQPGDEVYVPAAQEMVTISGEVRYPGSYELLPGETLQALLTMAGGLLPDAHPSAVVINQIDQKGLPNRQSVDLSAAASTTLANGDRVDLPGQGQNREMVLVEGAVFGALATPDKPVAIPVAPIAVNVPYTPGLTLLMVLEALGGPTPFAQADQGLIVRRSTGDRVPVDIEDLWSTRDRSKDVRLEPGDTVAVPMVTDVFVAGEVRSPGKLPYSPNLVVSDYLVASGGINPDTGDPNAIWFVDKLGRKTRAKLELHRVPREPSSWWIRTRGPRLRRRSRTSRS